MLTSAATRNGAPADPDTEDAVSEPETPQKPRVAAARSGPAATAPAAKSPAKKSPAVAAPGTRTELFRIAFNLLRGAAGEPPPPPITVTLSDGRQTTVTLHYDALEMESLGVAPTALTPMERRLLRIAGLEPLLAKQFAAKAGYRSMPHVYAGLSHLCKLGLLVRDPNGYRLPD